MRSKTRVSVLRSRGRTWLLVDGCCLLLLAAAVPLALAQTDYDLSWWTVDGGGQMYSVGGGYELGGTIGQPDAGVLTGAGYTLGGGFWRGGTVVLSPYHVYLPLIVR
jgi:hypothetical protein